jgi:ActR/RegA family two-component response regulator
MTRSSISAPHLEKKALVVHPDVSVLSALQGEFSKRGITTVVARDIPTTLLAVTQHYFDFAVVASRIREEGDGWTVAGVLRLVFPRSTVVAIAPGADVLTLKAAINNGVDELCEAGRAPEQVVATALQSEKARSRGVASPRVQ